MDLYYIWWLGLCNRDATDLSRRSFLSRSLSARSLVFRSNRAWISNSNFKNVRCVYAIAHVIFSFLAVLKKLWLEDKVVIAGLEFWLSTLCLLIMLLSFFYSCFNCTYSLGFATRTVLLTILFLIVGFSSFFLGAAYIFWLLWST